jgi:hypothetical protein
MPPLKVKNCKYNQGKISLYRRVMVQKDTGSLVSLVLLISCGGVRLSPVGMSGIIWPIVPAPDDI